MSTEKKDRHAPPPLGLIALVVLVPIVILIGIAGFVGWLSVRLGFVEWYLGPVVGIAVDAILLGILWLMKKMRA